MRLTWDVAVCDGHRAWLPTVPPHYLLHDAMRCPGCTVTFIPELPAAGPSPEPAAGEAAGASTAGKRSAPAATPTSDTGGGDPRAAVFGPLAKWPHLLDRRRTD